MIDLRKTTFIIPVYLESSDRKTNFLATIPYLTKHLNTNIIILEWGETPVAASMLCSIKIKPSKLEYIFSCQKPGNLTFHRTKFLNQMLHKVTTPVVVNYDVDILLTPETYKTCQDLILSGQDLVYPYFWGNSQYKVSYNGRNKIVDRLNLNSLQANDIQPERSEYGHCQFFNTESYRAGGMENEGFVSYGPEDQERGWRFKQLGYNVMWADSYVYHLEHSRGINSSSQNPAMNSNNQLFEKLKAMSESELINYYKNVDYIKKYT